MKTTKILAVCSIAAMLTAQTSFAANHFWVAATPSNFNNPVNWSAASGGVPGASVPGLSDIAIFDGGGSGNCNYDINIEVGGLEVTSGYSGTIFQNTFTLYVSGNASFSGGGLFRR